MAVTYDSIQIQPLRRCHHNLTFELAVPLLCLWSRRILAFLYSEFLFTEISPGILLCYLLNSGHTANRYQTPCFVAHYRSLN